MPASLSHRCLTWLQAQEARLRRSGSLDEDELREETGLGAARMTYAGHLLEATGTTPALAWVINAIVDALAEFGVRHA